MTRSVVAVCVLLLGTVACLGQEADDRLYQQWERAIALREDKQFDAAAEVFQAIATEHPDAEEIIRLALNQIVFTRTQDGQQGSADVAARQALNVYPDLLADTIYIPQSVNDLYDRLRREMFGSVTVRKPEGARISLNGEFRGEAPLYLPYIPAGDYLLQASRSNFLDYEERITVAPDGRHEYEIAMTRRKNSTYWLTRIGGGAIVTGALVFLATKEADVAPTESLLPGAPSPPGP
jgi:hypothetical protein